MQLKQLNGNEKCIVLTEDSNTSSLLSYVLKASGFKMSETNIISYEGCSKLSSANLFAIFVKEKMPHVKIVVHRDRDYLTPDEIEDLANQFRRIDVHFFITKGTDIESHFLNPKHVKACHPGLSDQDAVRLVDQCLHETRSKSVDMLRKKEFGGGNVIRHTHLNQALEIWSTSTCFASLMAKQRCVFCKRSSKINWAKNRKSKNRRRIYPIHC
jgi:hypothetical protein